MFRSRVHTIPYAVRTEGIDILQGHMQVSLRSSFIRIRLVYLCTDNTIDMKKC